VEGHGFTSVALHLRHLPANGVRVMFFRNGDFAIQTFYRAAVLAWFLFLWEGR
jgi:hypothetical protein